MEMFSFFGKSKNKKFELEDRPQAEGLGWLNPHNLDCKHPNLVPTTPAPQIGIQDMLQPGRNRTLAKHQEPCYRTCHKRRDVTL